MARQNKKNRDKLTIGAKYLTNKKRDGKKELLKIVQTNIMSPNSLIYKDDIL